ncbi:double-cubane-cluster-containing anaerobic reductase [Desulfocicer niacini]
MQTSVTSGLEKALKIYQSRHESAVELASSGKKIMGYFCSYAPLEMLTAMDFVPFRIQGSMDESITKADSHIPTIACPILRSGLDLGLKGKYTFLDGFVAAHTCDCQEKFCSIWQHTMKPSYFHLIDMPHVADADSVDQFKTKLKLFQSSLEAYTGRKMDMDRLKEEIALHNRQRQLVADLYRLKQSDPPLLSGTETLQIMIALMCMPIEEGSLMLEDIIEELPTRKDAPAQKGARLLLWGTPLTETGIIRMIESADAHVVMDDTCAGTRHFLPKVEITEDPLDGIAQRYLDGIKCPRTVRQTTASFSTDMETRFGYLKEYVEKWKVDGVILQSVRYCDTHGFEVPDAKSYFRQMGIPAIYLEHEYTRVALAPLQTRVEAFLETIA